ncbi:MAG: FAD-binding protein [Burkholderiaceae bacterium]
MPDPTDSSALLALRERVRTAVADKQPLAIHGGRTKAFYGQPEQGQPLDTREYRGIVAYDPTELVITARAGTPAEIHDALAGAGQFLPFEPPAFAPGATVGGMVATGLSGLRRQAVGSVRDSCAATLPATTCRGCCAARWASWA